MLGCCNLKWGFVNFWGSENGVRSTVSCCYLFCVSGCMYHEVGVVMFDFLGIGLDFFDVKVRF